VNLGLFPSALVVEGFPFLDLRQAGCLLLLVRLVVLMVRLKVLLVTVGVAVVVALLAVLVVRPSVRLVVRGVERLLPRKFALGLLLPQVFLQGYLNLFGLGMLPFIVFSLM
jgi:hypothetical protein